MSNKTIEYRLKLRKWGELPKCLGGAWGCEHYSRGRCRQLTSCAYKEAFTEASK